MQAAALPKRMVRPDEDRKREAVSQRFPPRVITAHDRPLETTSPFTGPVIRAKRPVKDCRIIIGLR